MSQFSKNRRDLLKTMTAGAVLSPFLAGFLKESFALAQGGKPLPKFVVFWGGVGSFLQEMPSTLSDTQTLQRSALFSPLTAIQSDLSVFEKIYDPMPSIDVANLGHSAAISVLSGKLALIGQSGNDRVPVGASQPTIDQMARAEWAAKGGSRKSLHLAIKNTFGGVYHRHPFWRDNFTSCADYTNPNDALKLAVLGGVNLPISKEQLPLSSIVDFHAAQIQFAKSGLGKTEQQNLDSMLSSIRDAEKATAEADEIRKKLTLPDTLFTGDPLAAANVELVFEAHLKVLIAGLKSGAVQVASLQIADTAGEQFTFPFLADAFKKACDAAQNTGTDDLSKFASGDLHYFFGHDAHATAARFTARIVIEQWFASKYVRIIQALKSEGLLDSSLVYWSSFMGIPGAHEPSNLFAVLGGGANGKHKSGNTFLCENKVSVNDILATALALLDMNPEPMMSKELVLAGVQKQILT